MVSEKNCNAKVVIKGNINSVSENVRVLCVFFFFFHSITYFSISAMKNFLLSWVSSILLLAVITNSPEVDEWLSLIIFWLSYFGLLKIALFQYLNYFLFLFVFGLLFVFFSSIMVRIFHNCYSKVFTQRVITEIISCSLRVLFITYLACCRNDDVVLLLPMSFIPCGWDRGEKALFCFEIFLSWFSTFKVEINFVCFTKG